jgi:hypothetical protein
MSLASTSYSEWREQESYRHARREESRRAQLEENTVASFDSLPYEVQSVILRYAVQNILEDLRLVVIQRETPTPSYSNRLQQWPSLRRTSKSVNWVLSTLTVQDRAVDVLLRDKQLEKLENFVEMSVILSCPPLASAGERKPNPRLNVPKLKYLCGKFWHNPDLTSSTVQNLLLSLTFPHTLNFAVKLESWVLRHRRRSRAQSASEDRILVFETGDWMVEAGCLRVRRVTRWQAPLRTRFGIYLASETGPSADVHARLGHERRWYFDFVDGLDGRAVLRCMVNYETKRVWDNTAKKLYDFDGRQYDIEYQGPIEEEEDQNEEDVDDVDEDDEDSSDEEIDYHGENLGTQLAFT